MRNTVALLLGLLSLQALAFTPVNLLNDKRNAFSKMPIHDQGPVGNCYSIVAASLLDHFRMSAGEKIDSPDKLSSTLWISTAFKKDDLLSNLSKATGVMYDEDSPLDSGTASGSLRSIRYRGLCTRGDMSMALKKTYPSVTSSELTVDVLSGMLENLNAEWRKLYLKALGSLRGNSQIEDSNPNYKFPRNIPGVITRPEYPMPPKPVAPVVTKPTQNTPPAPVVLPPLTFQDFRAVADNTRVQRPLIMAMPQQQTTKAPIKVYEPYKIQPAVSDNTYVRKPNVDVYFFDLAVRYANRTIEAALNAAYHVLPEFVSTLVSKLKKDEGYWDIANSLYKSCSSIKKPAPNFEIKKRIPLSEADLIRNASNLLSAGKPFGIGYCSQVLKDGKGHNYITSSKCGRHASVVVGIKDPQAPKFLIQNSWGKGCSGYHSSLECVPGQGAIWVPSGVLYKSLMDMTWLD